MGELLPMPRPDERPHRRSETRSSEPLLRELLGHQLREVRRERGERLVDVAERAGVSPQYLSEVERGLKDPSSEILAAVSGALLLPLRELTSRIVGELASAPVSTVSTGRTSSDPVCLAA